MVEKSIDKDMPANFLTESHIESMLAKHHSDLIVNIRELLSSELQKDREKLISCIQGAPPEAAEEADYTLQQEETQETQVTEIAAETSTLKWRESVGDTRSLTAQKIYEVPRQTRGPRKSSTWTVQNMHSEKEERQSRQALHPDSKFKFYWDSLSILLLGYDLLTVPVFFAWQLSNPVVFVSSLFISIFWSVDILITFNTGYHTPNVEVERNPKKAAMKYLKGWFAIDFVLATLDWVTFFLGNKAYKQVARILKLCVRVPSKVPRVRELYASLKMRIKSQYTTFFLDVFNLLSFLVFQNHILACLWFFIGQNPILCDPDCDKTWMSQGAMSGRSFRYEYLTSLHWAITQMTPASMEVVPENTGERLITICIIIFGLVLAAAIVSTMTSILTQIRVQSDAKMKSNMQLGRFLKQEHVNDELRLQVMRQVTWRLRQTIRLRTSDVHYISLTSRSLQKTLNYVVNFPKLSGHNMFAAIDSLCETSMKQFCTNVKITAHAKEDSIFEEGAVGSEMYFVTYGQARYTPGPEAFEFDNNEAKVTIDALDWCSEPALWVEQWVHLGSCVCTCQSEMLAPNATDLVAAVKASPDVHGMLEEYSKTFLDYCNYFAAISDLGSIYDPVEIYYGLGHHVRYAIMDQLINNMQKNASSSQKKKLDVLREEARSGKSNIAVVKGCGVMRIVYLAALRITLNDTEAPLAITECEPEVDLTPTIPEDSWQTSTSTDNKFSALSTSHKKQLMLYEVAEFSKKKMKYEVKCNMPGTKRREQESAADAARRLLKKDLTELIKAGVQLNVKSCVDHSFSKKSPTYGVNTKYVKSCFNATLTKDNLLSLPTKSRSGDAWTSESKCREAAAKAAVEVKWSLRSCLHKRHDNGGWSENAQEAELLLKERREVVSLAEGHRLYLWLTPDESEMLAHEDAAIPLQEWIRGFSHPALDPDPDLVPVASAPPETADRANGNGISSTPADIAAELTDISTLNLNLTEYIQV